MPQLSKRHHYIPCFYSSFWTNETGVLRQYSRPYQKVKVERKYPKQVGFGDGLYDLMGVGLEQRSYLEDNFFNAVDYSAAEAMRFMLENRTADPPENLRCSFAKLLTSFHHRTPEGVERIKAGAARLAEEIIGEYRLNPGGFYRPDAIRRLPALEVEDAIRQYIMGVAWGITLQNVTNSTMVNSAIIRMGWTICELDHTRHTLLTSDIPLVKSNGLAQSYGHLSVAFGPKRLFIATNNRETLDNIMSVGPQGVAERFNHEVVKQARSYVFGFDDRQIRFVENRLRRKIKDPNPG